jgi:PadR family transcriptional regulator, regulatory protein PadR
VLSGAARFGSIGCRELISPTFPVGYPLAVTDRPVRVTEPLLDVLEALLEARDYELYGWAITKATRRASPTVYKILERLTDHGMVTARWEDRHPDVNKPRRRFYRLTGHGAAVARTLLQERRPQRRHPHSRPRPAVGWAGA